MGQDKRLNLEVFKKQLIYLEYPQRHRPVILTPLGRRESPGRVTTSGGPKRHKSLTPGSGRRRVPRH